MAVTSIWRVKGWLGKVVVYIENPDKTTNPAYYEKADMSDRERQGLEDVIAYAVNSEKTQQADPEEEIMQRFVSGVNCFPATARTEMMAVKKRFGKEDGTVAYHGYQSFAPGEATPEIAHQIGVELAKRLWGDRYQVVVATHLDKENHLHNHFVLNTVSFTDGIKFHRTEKDYWDMRKLSDDLCREYGLSVIDNPQPGKSKQYGEWRAEQEQRPTWRGIIRSDIDEVIRQSMTERQFFEYLHRKGYEVHVGKDISVRPPGKPRFVRLARNFGEDYTLDGIRRRILEQTRAAGPLPEPAPKSKRYRVSGNWQAGKKATGFRALYLHYCYLLGVFPKDKPQNRKRLHFLLREDLIKLENITQEARLLAVHHIDTAQQLSSYKNELETRMEAVASQRKQLYRKQRTVAVRSDEAASGKVKAEIDSLSKELCQLRKEVKLCSDIEVRSGVMLEHIQTVRQDERSQRKEKQEHEQFRRRGGASR
ncbi:MAG: relaxase/mobilization nuclease domain-containing protein [Faecousia sp.]